MGIERTAEAYQRAFELERAHEYPVIDAFEERMGFAVDRDRLEAAARVLACPLKKNPPNWQHGRVVYALAKHWYEHMPIERAKDTVFLDIGTAKGFSAVCMAWAAPGQPIMSFDVIRPESNEPRNSVLDYHHRLDGILDYVEDFIPEPNAVSFGHVSDKEEWLSDYNNVSFAFIDGSHTYEGVKADIAAVTPRQQPGDICMFDDLQVPGIAQAVSELEGYDIEYIDLLPKRKYAIAVKQ